MKTRNGFVSNSSSSSFILPLEGLSVDQIEAIKHHAKYAVEKGWIVNDRSKRITITERDRDGDNTKPKTANTQDCGAPDAWDISILERHGIPCIVGGTSMDNFDMGQFLRNIDAIDSATFDEDSFGRINSGNHNVLWEPGYTVKSTKKSAQVIRKALRVYVQMCSGNLSYIRKMRKSDVNGDLIEADDFLKLDQYLIQLKECLFTGIDKKKVRETKIHVRGILKKIANSEYLNVLELWTVSTATEMLARLQIGQFSNAIEYLPTTNFWNVTRHDDISHLDEQIKWVLFRLERNTTLGVGSRQASWEKDVAFSIHQVIRHRLAWDQNPLGAWTVNYDSPMNWHKKVPLIELEPNL